MKSTSVSNTSQNAATPDQKDNKTMDQKAVSTTEEIKFQKQLNEIYTKIKALSKELPQADKAITLDEIKELGDTALKSKENILKIPHKIKTLTNTLTTSRTAYIHIHKVHSELSTIKVNVFKEQSLTAHYPDGLMVLTFKYKNKNQEYYFIKNDEGLMNAITELSDLGTTLKMTEFALQKGMVLFCDHTVLPAKYWDSWEDPKRVGLYYDTINDPLIEDQFVKQVLPLSENLKKEEKLTVIDVGAGQGRLADKLINLSLKKNIPITYYLIEPSQVQRKAAEEKLKARNKNKSVKTFIINSTLAQFSPGFKAHCVISSGGVININNTTRAEGIANVSKLCNLLQPKGILIATGLTAILVKGKHFQQAGMNILSYSAPFVIPPQIESNAFIQVAKEKCSFFNNLQRYVCQKIDDNPEVAAKKHS